MSAESVRDGAGYERLVVEAAAAGTAPVVLRSRSSPTRASRCPVLIRTDEER